MLLRKSTTLPNTSLHSVSPMSGIIRHSATSGAKVISICKQPRVHCPRGYTRRRSSAMGGGSLLEIGSEARQSKIQVQGDVAQTPLITAHQRELLLECARAFNDVPRAAITGIEPARQRGARPGDEFNTQGSWDDILVPRSWSKVGRRGDVTWRVPVGLPPFRNFTVLGATIRRRQDFGVDQISDFLLDLRRDTFFKPRFCALPARKSELLMGVDRKPFGAQVMLSKLTASC